MEDPRVECRAPESSGALRNMVKPLVALAVALAALALVYFTPLRALLAQREELSRFLHSIGWLGPVLFTAFTALLVGVGVPRLLLCAAGGLTFGFWQGLLWSQVGTVIGSYTAFCIARWGGRDAVLRKWPALGKYERAIGQGGIWTVILAKQVPITGLCVNCLLGITRLRHRDFLLGTLVGILPEAVPATLVGAGAAQETFGHSALFITIGVVFFVLLVLAIRFVAKRRT